MHPNTMQHQNMSLGSNRVDWVWSLRKIPTWLHGTNFCINCTSSHYFVPSFMQLRNDPKWTQTLCNSPKHEFRVQWNGLGAFVAKNPDVTSWHPVFHRVSCSYETIPNALKHYATGENMSLGSNGVDWVRSLRKIPTWLLGTNFCINCTSSHYFVPSFMQLRNDPKWSQTLCNSPKHEFRVQWSGLGAFVAKNRDVTSWHSVFHRVSCSYEMIPNAPNHYATSENMSLGSNGMDWVPSLRKIPTWLRCTNFCINAPVHPVLHRVSCSYERIPNASQHYWTHQNMTLGSNGADWVRPLWKNPYVTSWHELLH